MRVKAYDLYLLAFILVFFHKFDELFLKLIGVSFETLTGLSLLAIIAVISIISFVFAMPFRNGLRMFNIGFLLFTLLFLYGIILDNPKEAIMTEAISILFFAISYYQGYKGKVFLFLDRYGLPIFIVSAFLVFMGFGFARGHLLLHHTEEFLVGTPTGSMAYETHVVLNFFPLLAALYYGRGGRSRFIGIGIVLVYLLFQFAFLKRAPTGRAFLALFLILVLFNKRITLKSLPVYTLVIFLVIAPLIILIIPDDLGSRFSQKDVSRFEESYAMFSEMSFVEHIFGRGLGGYYYLSDGAGLIEIDEEGNLGKYILHIGVSYAYLKGGLIMMLFLTYFYVILIYRAILRLRTLTRYEKGSVIYIVTFIIFRFIEGPPSIGVMIDVACLGIAAGGISTRVISTK